jgi:hypothetical protein
MTPRPDPDFDPNELAPWDGTRHVELVPASSIKVKPVHWLWKDRIPLGELTLLAGRESLGKSTIAYTLAAWVTRGTMKGDSLTSLAQCWWPQPRTAGSTRLFPA